MNFLREVMDQGRRVTVDVLNGGGIDNDSPWSPEVPEDLREWLPDLFDRFPIVFPWHHPTPVDPALHTVWLLDNTAFRKPKPGDNRPDLADLQDANATDPKVRTESSGAMKPAQESSGWAVEFVACYFIKNSGKNLAHIVAEISHQLNVRDEDIACKKRIASRLEPFIDSVLPKHTVRISIQGREEQTLGPSSHSGISSSLNEIHFAPPLTAMTSNPLTIPPPFGLPCTTVMADEQGWGVISDIDDTIKITQSTDPLGVLANTFTVENPAPVAGMPELYAHLSQILAQPPFFYLSASPYNLYSFLRRFRDHHYPQGTIILRDASWQNLGGLVASLNQNTKAYKDDRITKIHSWLPHRRFFCVGDSTQSDPEAYGEAARKYPGWIKGIFIRKVSGIAQLNEKEKNSDERFERAFQGLDREMWHVFTDPAEVKERIEELVVRQR
ncbi:phosphatidate phosphatase app1 [Acrodontium crateriforme]|uniref:Phosphatidate phosphatase app1 n=1 Tax=Acrodontium crateriforme TaxID=150365 RepID=A0AAQ3MAX7_9PEZI|nr:phosphatidate phosphatase app1 [Acrodontium crateriforme]